MLAIKNYTRGRRRVKTRLKQIRRKQKESEEFKTMIQLYKTKYLAFRCELLEQIHCKLVLKIHTSFRVDEGF